MKKYNISFLSRLIPLILCCLTTGYLLFLQKYSLAITALAVAGLFIFSLYKFMKRPVLDAKRLIDAIQFSEFNISFRNFDHKGLFPELIPRMERAVQCFNRRLQQTEIEQQFYEMLLNRIDSPILVFDKMNAIEWINKAASDEFGKPQPRQLADLAVNATDLPDILKAIMPGEVKMIKIKKNEQTRRLAATAVLFSSRGKLLKIVSFKNIQSVLEESESDAWKKLIRVLTHEMMNSITPIISLAESLSELHVAADPISTAVPNSINEHDYKIMRKAMQTIHRRSKGLVEFVCNYRQLARIPAPVMDAFSAAEMMSDISNLMQADDIRFSYKIRDNDMILFADRSLMEQVLINLLKNAWEACAGKPSPEVNVQIFKNPYQNPVIIVSDNGCGILPDVQDKIFVPFFTTKAGGSGIGLSICRQIIISHGGSITVKSEPDKGARVILRLSQPFLDKKTYI